MILVIDIGNTTIAFTGLVRKSMDPVVYGGPGDAADLSDLREPAESVDFRASVEPVDFQVLFEEKLPTGTGRDRVRFLQEAEALCSRHGIQVISRDGEPGQVPDVSDGYPPDRSRDCGSGSGSSLRKPRILQEISTGSSVALTAISSVVPECTPAAEEFALLICGTPPVHISCRCDSGLSFGRIPNPEKLGADRIADAAWAAAAVPLPAMTADLGTATTVNVISKTGEFMGGMIGAGVRTSLQALRSGTAQLPDLDPGHVPPQQLIGTDTAACMRSAAVAGTACMIDGLAARVEEQLGEPVSLILTGGNAVFAAPWVRHPFILEPSLAAKGAALIALRMRSTL